jgi:hypothetical protein
VIVSATGPGVKVMKMMKAPDERAAALARGHFRVDVRQRKNTLCA